MQFFKDLILKIFGKKRIVYIIKYRRKNKSLLKTLSFGIKTLFLFYAPSKKLSNGKKVKRLFNKVNININSDNRFVYNIDVYKSMYRDGRVIENISIDYSRVLDESLNDIKKRLNKLKDSSYKVDELLTVDAINEYIDRECVCIEKCSRDDKEKLIAYLQNIKNGYPKSFEEAIQRILFFNQLLWQCGHGLMGFGELDRILCKYYDTDIKNNIISRDDAKDIICDMLHILHKNYWWKSGSLLGDTGQIIILGGMKNEKEYFCHDLTYLFIEAIKEVQLPDPKVLLKVSRKMPRDLMELSLDCIKTGIGSPLLSNDEVIIPKLIKFGYDKKDAYDYVTSACWEPLIASKSIDQNNIDSIVFIEPLTKMLNEENLYKIKDFKLFMNKYYNYLKEYLIDFTNNINKIEWENSPILSLFTDGCDKNSKDIGDGGAIYNNYGLTGVSLSNTVNSIYNIKKIVFDEKKYTLEELNNYRKNNYEENKINNMLRNQPIRYGTQNDEIINLTNEITSYVDKVINKIPNKFGGKFKFGFSAPTYILKSKGMEASFDGRYNGEPFGVHISSDKPSLAYTELIQFASQLDYSGNRFNGNVIDFMIVPSFIENNFDKMVDFLMLSIDLGFFQMQMNVISSDTLIKARANPKDYEGLIVRVWGFSAYFNELPDEYKDLLIERALKNEGKSK